MEKIKYLFFVMLAACSISLYSCSDDDDEVGTAPAPGATGSWTDTRDGKEYGWVRYGNLEWTTNNLGYVPTAGSTLPSLTPVASNVYDDGVAANYYQSFGLLYNHEAALAAVPEGWRLPTNDDWTNLANVTNGDIQKAINLGLGGYYVNEDFFQQIHPKVDYYAYIYGFYWSSSFDDTKPGNNFAFYRKIVYNQKGSEIGSMDKTYYMSVRLVRDAK